MRGGSRSPRLLTYDMVRVQYEYVPTCALPSSRSLPVSCSPEEEPISSRSRMSGWRGREEKEEKGETREEGIKKGGPKRGSSLLRNLRKGGVSRPLLLTSCVAKNMGRRRDGGTQSNSRFRTRRRLRRLVGKVREVYGRTGPTFAKPLTSLLREGELSIHAWRNTKNLLIPSKQVMKDVCKQFGQ